MIGLDLPALTNVIGDQRVPAASGQTLAVTDPATGAEVGRVPLSGPADVDAAVRAARAAAPGWAATPVTERARRMFRLHQLIEQAGDELGALVTRENGKAKADARAEVMRGLEVIEFAAGMPTLMQGGALSNVARDVDAETRRYPVGVMAGITPFNFPAMIPLWMMPIAVTAGNAFILKPSEQTPLTSMRLVDLFLEAGIPEGVVNIVHGGPDAVNALLDRPGIQAISFVGSAPPARHVYVRGTAAGKRAQALAGAKNFLIVLDDADLNGTAHAVFGSAFGNAGERCLAGSVVLATPGIADRLIDALADRVHAAPVGPGEDDRNVITPVISPAARVFRERIEAGMLGINVGVPAPVGLFPSSGKSGIERGRGGE